MSDPDDTPSSEEVVEKYEEEEEEVPESPDYLKYIGIAIIVMIVFYAIYVFLPKNSIENFFGKTDRLRRSITGGDHHTFFENIPMRALHAKEKPRVSLPIPEPARILEPFYETSSIRSQYLPKLSVAFST